MGHLVKHKKTRFQIDIKYSLNPATCKVIPLFLSWAAFPDESLLQSCIGKPNINQDDSVFEGKVNLVMHAVSKISKFQMILMKGIT